jgi:hypothetical protein
MNQARASGRRPGLLAAKLLLAGLLALSADAGSAFAVSATTKPVPPKPAAAAIPAKKVTTPAQRCKDLEGQFDVALSKHSGAKMLTAAQKLRADGERLCDAGQHAAGALRLAKALVDLGVKPDVN